MQTSKYNASYETIKKFVLEHENDLNNATVGKFRTKYPEIEVSDATYYSARRKALGLPSYGDAKKKKKNQSATNDNTIKFRNPREKMYKQFFMVSKKETTKESLALLSRFIEKMNNSNYNTKFEIIEYILRTNDGNNEPIIEVREFK